MDRITLITRRAALVGAAVSSAALAVPAAAMQKPEPAHERVYRLARELAAALADPEWQGFKRATVTPNQTVLDDPRSSAQRPPIMDKAIADHKRALQALNDSCDAADRMSSNYAGAKAEARQARLGRAEDRAMVVLLATAPIGTAEAKAKRRYLLPFCDDLQPHHIEALLYA